MPITLCGSLSRVPVALGAAMHNAGYRALELPFSYIAFRVEDLVGALAGMRALGIRGFGISVPFKQQILPLLDELDPVAARIGAVNTVVNAGGRLTGHNTDWWGAVRAFEEASPALGKRVLVLGAGGAARAVAYGLQQAGAQLTLSNRSDGRGAALARELGAVYCPWAERAQAPVDAIVNATSAGMAGNSYAPAAARGTACNAASPFPAEALHSAEVVMDLVYKPLDTALLQVARQAQAIPIHGGRMLLYQAARQFELYTEREAPLAAMQEALERAMAEQAQSEATEPR